MRVACDMLKKANEKYENTPEAASPPETLSTNQGQSICSPAVSQEVLIPPSESRRKAPDRTQLKNRETGNSN